MLTLAKCSPSLVYSACVEIGDTLVAFKTVNVSFKLVPTYILFLAELKGEGRPFWSGQA